MRVLLVNPERCTSRGNENFGPLGLGYLASYAKQRLPSVEFKIISTRDAEDILKEKPDLVGFSSVSQSFGYTQNLMRETVRRGIPTLVGGVHISLLPATLPSGGAVGVIGEGEQTFAELLGMLETRGHFDQEQLAGVRGIVYWRDGGQLIRTAPRPPIQPLDTVPMPDRELYHIKPGGVVYLFSSRGCPFDCIFCASTKLYEKVRFHSADYVVKEVQFLIDRYRPLLIKFYDDLFIASKARLREIVEKITEAGLHRKALFSVNAAASMIDEEVAGLLKKMNVYTVGMGLESGNREILAYLKVGNASIEQNERAINILVQHNLNPTASFIVGAPAENEEKFTDTLRFIARTKLAKAYLYLLTPYPGTALWDYALQKGCVANNMDWARLDVSQNDDFSKRVILSEHLNADTLRKLFRQFNSLQRKNYFKRLIMQGLKQPNRIIFYIKLHWQKLWEPLFR